MARPVSVQWSAPAAVDAERAFHGVLACDLRQVFRRRFGPLPAITDVRDQDGAWSAVGQTRTIVLGDGSQMVERLEAVDAPARFAYRLTGLTGPLGLLAAHVDGQWTFAPAPGGGSTVTWRWRLHPRHAAAIPALLVLGLLWRGYARQGLAELTRGLGG